MHWVFCWPPCWVCCSLSCLCLHLPHAGLAALRRHWPQTGCAARAWTGWGCCSAPAGGTAELASCHCCCWVAGCYQLLCWELTQLQPQAPAACWALRDSCVVVALDPLAGWCSCRLQRVPLASPPSLMRQAAALPAPAAASLLQPSWQQQRQLLCAAAQTALSQLVAWLPGLLPGSCLDSLEQLLVQLLLH